MQQPAVEPDRILRLGYAYRDAKALLSAVELGVFTALAQGPLDCGELARRAGVHPRGAADFFDALVALGMLERDAHGRYSNTREADVYLDRGKPTYIGDDLDHLNVRLFPYWQSLTKALQTGQPQTGAAAAGNFPAIYSDAKALELFARGMSGGTLPPAQALARKFDWSRCRTFVDIGTAQGCLPVLVAEAHSHLTGGGFDLPPLRDLYERHIAERGLAERLRFYPGDFFRDPFPESDVIVLGRVLHNWDRDTKLMLLRKAHDALPAGGTVIVYERLIDDERRRNAQALLASLNMLLMTAGGFDFTAADCIAWMRQAGFRDMRLEPLAADHSMVVGRK